MTLDNIRKKRLERAESLVGIPFLQLPGKPPQHQVCFVSREGVKVRVEAVEMVFNDALLMDAINGWEAPLYVDGYPEGSLQREVYDYALKAFAGVEIPAQLRNPKAQ
jgi:hypothetical protein